MILEAFGGDPTGARPSDDALRAALTALGDGPGVIGLSAGTYRFTEAGHSFGIGQGLVGPGHAVCALVYEGPEGRFLSFAAGSRFEALQNSTGAPQGGPVRGFAVENRGRGPIDAVVWSDLCAADIDIAIKGFSEPGSHGLLFENLYGFCEGSVVRAGVQNCDTAVRFTSARRRVADIRSDGSRTTFVVPEHGLIDGSWVVIDGCAGVEPHRFGVPYASVPITVIDADTFAVAVPSTGRYRGGATALCGRFSFDYSRYDFWVVAAPGQNGVVIENGSAMYGCDLTLRGNFIGRGTINARPRPDTGFAPAVLTIGNAEIDDLGDGNPRDHASFTGAVHITVECEGDAEDVGHSTVAYGGYHVPTGLIGEMLFLAGAAGFSDAQGLFEGANMSFMGIGDLHPVSYGSKYPLTVQNTKPAQKPGGAWVTGRGDQCTLNLSLEGSTRFAHSFSEGGEVAVNFQNPAAERLDGFDLLIQQPASGAVILRWPARVSWGVVGAPTLSVGGQLTDWLRFMTLDGGRSWFGSVVAQGLGG